MPSRPPTSEADVITLLREAVRTREPLTFRAGGSSLSGQAQSDAVLADVRRHFTDLEVLDGGDRVRVGPGVTLHTVNAHLLRHGRRLGPDPASEIACTIGGVIANNSSGMAAGTQQNTYRTLDTLRFVLPSGTVVDTSAPDADARLREDEPELHEGLVRLVRRVRDDAEAVRIIRERFALKNTMGYGINALLVFPSLHEATAALPAVLETGMATAELLDSRSLTVAQRLPASPQEIRGLTVTDQAALLVEQRANSLEEIAAGAARGEQLARGLKLDAPFAMSTDPRRRAALWTTRKGLYAAVAGARPSGATALLEDVVVPVPQLDETCAGLQELFTKHGYEESVIFGHAKDGNIHFLLNEMLGDGADRYEAFTEDMVDLVLGHGGNLKAEHGTGRVMAPFVERQYGSELYGVMREIKHLVDPTGILNPGVLLTEDPLAHIRDLKPVVEIEDEADRCVECGYCEPVCPSRNLTLTPRQRIVLRRDAAWAETTGDVETARAIRADYEYDGIQTCAVDGMCVTTCPVGINTGDLVRRLRAEEAPKAAQIGWAAAAKHWDATTRAASTALSAAGTLPRPLPEVAAGAARLVLGDDNVPSYRPELPRHGGTVRHAGGRGLTGGETVAVYMPACVHTMFGDDGEGPQAALTLLAERAGVRLVVPDGTASLCCGTPFSSKGMLDAKKDMQARLRRVLGGAAGSTLPVIVDAASCTEGVLGAFEGTDTEVIDAVTFVRRVLLDRLTIVRRTASVTVHPTCSTTHLGATEDLVAIAEACAEEVVVPTAWGCCAYAGDRGMLHPELTESATRGEAAEVAEHPTADYVSANRTCELGMIAATGKPYRHILELLEEATA
ncbi:FAD-binding and (Fe-S)-binding domain-containing protein [Brachybacterium sp. AOP25-B2-12]|uniref:FAD-binding and (Fe-S)-binding domain-containing protein n=1 Tax=Brachybacterium sp. AOP25-B2-12 TaxID=3457710 RepID=UPI004033A687